MLISFDRGQTWHPMPEHFQQDGRIVGITDLFVIQAVGRGHEIWYAREPPIVPEKES